MSLNYTSKLDLHYVKKDDNCHLMNILNDKCHFFSDMSYVVLQPKLLNMETKVIIQNLKCDGCKNAITKRMQKIQGISNISINIDKSEVSFSYTTHNALEGLREELTDLGYPITGDPNTILEKAKSFVQCAVGKISLLGF